MTFKLALSLLTSALTLWGMWLAGSKDWRGWLVGLLNQSCWLAFIVVFEAWGLLPLSAALIVIYSRNLIAWRREDRAAFDDLMAHMESPVERDL